MVSLWLFFLLSFFTVASVRAACFTYDPPRSIHVLIPRSFHPSCVPFTATRTWGECEVPEIRRSCAVPAFPIFQLQQLSSGEDLRCRSCSCNTFFYAVDANCTSLAQAAEAAAATNQSVAGPTTCGAAHAGDGPRYASQVLGLSPAILSPAATIFVRACPSDTGLLGVLGSYIKYPSIIHLDIAPEEAVVDHEPEGSHSSTFTPVNWTFPSSFSDQWRSLAVFQMIQEHKFLLVHGQSHRNLRPVQVTRWPPLMWELPALRVIDLVGIGLTSLPSEIGQLTALRSLIVKHNRLEDVPASIANLVFLKRLYLSNNLMASVPAALSSLTTLERLHLNSNSRIAFVPSFLGQLSKLRALQLDANSLTTIPTSILTAPRPHGPLRLSLEANNISLATMETFVSAIGSASQHVSGTRAEPSVVLMGANPACQPSRGAAGSGNSTNNVAGWFGNSGRVVGDWQLVCKPECAVGCFDTPLGTSVTTWLGDGDCDVFCETAACRWDGGDCAAG